MKWQAVTGRKEATRFDDLVAVLVAIGGDRRAWAAVVLFIALWLLIGADGASAGYRFP